MQEKLFLIVINIQKNQTICFQIIGMPSLSFSIIYALGGRWGNLLAGRHGGINELLRDDSGFLALASLHKRRVKGDSCAIGEVNQTANS